MRNVFLSFLGTGDYKKVNYLLNDKTSSLTGFVQVAEIELLDINFDSIIIIATQKSFDDHFEELKKEIIALGKTEPQAVIISEDMSSKAQWVWFERILPKINYNDSLVVDLTHGYRSIPIVFSTAINFLQKSKNVEILGVYYGAFEKDKSLSPIIDMKDFYIINEWAEAVSRLVEDADAKKLAEISKKSGNFQITEFNDDNLVNSLLKITDSLKNVDIQYVGDYIKEAIGIIENKLKNSSKIGKLMLQLVIDKFVPLAIKTDIYNKPYFELQLKIVKLLLEHKLFMQGFTVMRELIGSIGMVVKNDVKTKSSKGKSSRKMYAELFLRMIQNDKDVWNFKDDDLTVISKLESHYNKLIEMDLLSNLQEITKEITDLRNGFDHAWTSRNIKNDIHKSGDEIFKKLEKLFASLFEKGILM